MTLEPISIATGGYVCGLGPDDIAIATQGYICSDAVAVEEEFGGHSGPDFGQKRRQFPVVDAEYYRRQKQVDEDVSLVVMMLAAHLEDE